LGEIEAQLARHEDIQEAVVMAREDAPGEKRLVAYVVGRQAEGSEALLSAEALSSAEALLGAEALRAYLKPKLPEYMLPSAFVLLERLPLTVNGKLDRKALPAPELGAYLSRQYEAPQGEIEEILGGIWQELLRVERVGRHDNFFELGGHSLRGLALIAKIKERLMVELSPITIFRNQTLHQLAGKVRSTSQLPVAMLVQDLTNKGVRLSVKKGRLHCQIPRGVLTPGEIRALELSKDAIIAMLERSSALAVTPTPVCRAPADQIPLTLTQALAWSPMRTYHRATTFARHIRGELNLEVFDKSIQRLIQRHEALRTRLVTVDGTAMQQVRDDQHYDLQVDDLTAIPDNLLENEIGQKISQCILHQIDPATDPLFTFKLLKLRPGEHVLIVATEHMISDAVSLGILWRDLLAIYASELRGTPDHLPEIPVQFADYAVWQSKAHNVWMERHGAAWADRMAGCRPVRFPTARDPALPPGQGWGVAQIKIESSLKKEWETWCRRNQTTLPLSALTAYAAVLLRWCAAPEVVIQFLTTGRSSPKVENTVGFFTSALYVRVQSREVDTFADLLNHVIDDYWQSYAIPDFCYLGADVPRPELSRCPSFNWLPQELKSSAETVAESITSEPISFHNPLFVHVDGDSDPGIVFQEAREEVYGNVIFPLNRFSTDSMEQFADNFVMVLKTMLARPQMRVQEMPLVPEVQDRQRPWSGREQRLGSAP